MIHQCATLEEAKGTQKWEESHNNFLPHMIVRFREYNQEGRSQGSVFFVIDRESFETWEHNRKVYFEDNTYSGSYAPPGECYLCEQRRQGDTPAPRHYAMARCESGKRDHCSCSICF